MEAYEIVSLITNKGKAAIKNCEGDRTDALYILWSDRDLTEIDNDYITKIFNCCC